MTATRTLTALYLFEHRNTETQVQEPSQSSVWSSQVHIGTRILFDRIVTRWKPGYLLSTSQVSTSALHASLTPESLLSVPEVFTQSQRNNRFNVKIAQAQYEQCFLPLLYHELWEGIKRDTQENQLSKIDYSFEIQIAKYEPQTTRRATQFESPIPTTLIFGSYSFQIDLSFTRSFPKLGLCDIVLINIDPKHDHLKFFGIIVHVVDLWPSHITDTSSVDLKDYENTKNVIQVESKVVLYVSKACSHAVKEHCDKTRPQQLSLIKLSNITSSRRHINAIYNLASLPEEKHRAVLNPTDSDPYFQYEKLDNFQEPQLDNFNDVQMRLINYAEQMFKVYAGKLVRVGRAEPLDHQVCDHFLESLTMEKLVEQILNGQPVTHETTDKFKENILKKAKVIVSTLNYTANNTLLLVKKKKMVKFIIVDEACQSLEADCLLSFYFNCYKIILVGDPKQLPPCVISIAGQRHNLSQSLYTRLASKIHQTSITLLTRQYRMHEDICKFPSAHFYDDRLITDKSTRNYWLDYPLEPYYLYNLTYTEHECPPNGGSSYNKEERIFIKSFCIKIIERLIGGQSYVRNDSKCIEMEKRMIVITPYKNQMKKFRDRQLEFPRHIEVITVDSAQGKEKDIVLISCVRSIRNGDIGTIGFLKDQHRLNVMLTRARRALYIFGNLTWLAENNSNWNALVDDATNRQVIDTIYNADQRPTLPE
ncbi:unnamed protein product [Rotaria socialis]|uniref:Uncharacterized protein n=1 Tax=Rotaria socialis TaxID=392032 RepID=A0A817Q0U4_9BILA|nr:unnamed protein product [Rotaria socialis]CAF4160598.1 unnamed protein product [Rotaria socialis]CAF4245015.1 unnamed protein product [Rotaria socialis]